MLNWILLPFFLVPCLYKTGYKEWVITSKSITVAGETSFGGFSCGYAINGLLDTLHLSSADKLDFDIPVEAFSCGNFMLNRDFRQTLKASEHPKANVEARDFTPNSEGVECKIILDIAGENIEFEKVQLKELPNMLEANLEMNFEDLGLSPPRKLGGLIEVDNKLSIHLVLGL